MVVIDWYEAIGFVAFLFTITSNIMLAQKNIKAWVLRQASTYAIVIGSIPLLLNASVYFLLNAYGYWNWRRLAKLEESGSNHG